ncbi:hypothetical protein LINPERHAP2_LOCUS32416 [Linum perenne]
MVLQTSWLALAMTTLLGVTLLIVRIVGLAIF